VNNVVIFLSANGINRLLKKCQYPKFAEKPVVFYDSAQVKTLYIAVIDEEERFTLDYFLKTGVRDGEAAHAEYTDVKDGFLNIVDKPHLKWHPKQWHIRRIPIPNDLIVAIAARQKKNPGCKLIFPNGVGRPNQHLLRVVQRVAERAGNTFHADLHTFRRTYATLFSGTTKIQTIQYLLGHKDIKTTMRYLGIPDLNSPETRRAVEETFKEFLHKLVDECPSDAEIEKQIKATIKTKVVWDENCPHRCNKGKIQFKEPGSLFFSAKHCECLHEVEVA
jgi:integrase